MATTVLGCVLAEVVVVGLSTLEQVRRFPPLQGEDWLVGMSLPNEDVVISEGLSLQAEVFGGD